MFESEFGLSAPRGHGRVFVAGAHPGALSQQELTGEVSPVMGSSLSDTSPLCGWRLESSKAAPGAEWHRQPNAAGMRVLRAAREERRVRADLSSGIHLPNGEEVAREQLSFS